MRAVIHFVGLLTFVVNTGITPGPPHILIPRFADIVDKENNVIRVPRAQVDTRQTTWKSAPGPNDTLDFFIGTQNIRIIGANAFTPNVGDIPHLTCCCPQMKEGLKSDYENPDHNPASKKAAYVRLEHGTLITYADPKTSAIHLDLLVDGNPDNQLVIEGEKNQKIVVNLLRPPSKNDIAFLNIAEDPEHGSHWLHYYKMRKDEAGLCLATPKEPNSPCNPRANGCLSSASSQRALKAKPKKVAESAFHRDLRRWRFIDINCSGSQWP